MAGNFSRRDDIAAKQLIERNRATIDKLADHLSAGAYSASRTSIETSIFACRSRNVAAIFVT